MSELRVRWLTLMWGFSEALFFVLVPDIILTRQSLLNRKSSWSLLAMAVGGALVGASVAYLLLHNRAEFYVSLLENLPGISTAMITGTERELTESGFWGVIRGSFGGMPFKLYTHAAFQLNVPLWLFLLWSLPARGLRFALLMLISSIIGKRARSVDRATLSRIHVGIWLAFYVAYFSYFPR